MSGAAEVSIVIVNWNGGPFLRAAVESVARHPPRVAFEIIVIDNASSDDSLDWLRAGGADALLGAGRVRLVENAENLGFSKGNNQGFALSDAPLLFLLNSDAEVRAGALDKLVETIRSDARVGAVGPRLVNPDGSLQASVFRNPQAAWEILVAGLRLDRLIPARLRGGLLLGGHWDHATRRDVTRVSGAAMMVRREVIEDVGGLDERFHMYGEDVEWCLRIARAGWRIVHEPEAVVMHHGSGSSKQRWGDLETYRRVIDGQLRCQEYCLSRPRLVSNILASAAVASLSYARRRAGGGPVAEQGTALSLYAKYLRRALAPARADDRPLGGKKRHA
jgi:N-acetylglucosaminyl-diphospho-decaprenol L-rhamnosyltransferase